MKYVVAPMVNGSDLPFRILASRYGADTSYTPMFHSKHFASSKKFRDQCCLELKDVGDQDPNLIVQFCGHDKDALLECGQYLEKHYKNRVIGLDLNLGCPQNIAKSGHYGAFLGDDEELVVEILEHLTAHLEISVSAKIRVKPTVEETLEYAKKLEATGIWMLGIHGRTKEERGSQVGPCDWDLIKRVKAELSIPVIANGGVASKEEADALMEFTQCEAVMAAEGLLTNPALFAGGTRDKVSLAKEYLGIIRELEWCPSMAAVKKHLFCLLHGGLALNLEARNALGKCRTVEECQKIVEGLEPNTSDAWYYRHRKQVE